MSEAMTSELEQQIGRAGAPETLEVQQSLLDRGIHHAQLLLDGIRSNSDIPRRTVLLGGLATLLGAACDRVAAAVPTPEAPATVAPTVTPRPPEATATATAPATKEPAKPLPDEPEIVLEGFGGGELTEKEQQLLDELKAKFIKAVREKQLKGRTTIVLTHGSDVGLIGGYADNSGQLYVLGLEDELLSVDKYKNTPPTHDNWNADWRRFEWKNEKNDVVAWFDEGEKKILEGYFEQVRAEVLGVSVWVGLVTDKTIREREDYPVEKVTLNREHYDDANQRFAEAVMRAHWHGWMNDDMDNRKNVTFETFMGRLRSGEDVMYKIAASAPAQRGTVMQGTVEVDPIKPAHLVYTDRRGMIFVAQNSSLSLKLNSRGELLIELMYDAERVKPYEKYPDTALTWTPSGLTLAGLSVLSLSEDFQKQGVRRQQGKENEASRIAYNKEFADVDDLIFPIKDADLAQHGNKALIEAILPSP